MATVDKNFKIKNGLIVGDSTNLVNYTSASPFDPFVGQLWISGSSLYAWSSASTWVLIGDGNTGGGGGSASGTQFNIPSTLIARSASGSFQIGAVDFHTASPVISSVGRITWDDGAGTALLGLKGGNINLPIGQQEDALVYNGTGSALARGQVVRIVGAQGQRPRIDLAAAISDANSSKTFGIVAEPILNAAEGFVTTFGIVSDINTAAFTEGASLWLSPSAGGIVSTMPIQPYHNVFLGYCLKSHASAGRIFVKIQNGYEIEELHDVLIQTASNNQILSYNSASSLWMNKDLQAAIKEVDGVSSGIDADLLDGQQGSYYLDWTNTTNKPDPVIGINLTGNTTGAASATLIDLTNGQISITTNTAHAGTASSIAGSLVTGTVANATNASQAATASSINWTGITNTPTTLSGYNISDGLRASDAASAYIRITSSAAIVSGYIPVSASQVYLTRTDAQIFYVPISGSSAIVANYIPVSSSQTYLTRSDANIIYAPLSSASLTGIPTAPTAASGTNTQQIATTAFVRTEVSNLIASAPTTLDTLNELAAALGNDPNFATSTASAIGQRLLASTASILYMSIGSTANHATSASSINWTGVTAKPTLITSVTAGTNGITIGGTATDPTVSLNSGASVTWNNISSKPSPIVGVNLTGNTIGAASATLSQLNNGQISITTQTTFATSASSIDWSLVTSRPSASPTLNPQIGISLTGNTTGAASVTLTSLNNGQLSITTNTAFAQSASSIAGSLVTGTVNNANQANTASSINWVGVTGTPTTLSGYNISDGLRASDAASAYIRVTSSAAIVSGYIPVSASQAYLTRSDAQIFYVPISGSSAIVSGYIPVSASQAYLTRSDATNTYLPLSGSISWGNVSNKPSPIVAVNLTGNTTGAASVTLTSLNNGQLSITTNTAFAQSASSIAGSLVTGAVNNALHSNTASSIAGLLVTGTVNNANQANTASSINWSGVTNKPDPIIGIQLTGSITGAASATLTDLNNAQITINTSGGGGAKIPVYSSPPLPGDSGSAYFNSTALTLNINIAGSWLEVGSVPPFDAGNSSTASFDGIFNNGTASTTVFLQTYNAGNSTPVELLA